MGTINAIELTQKPGRISFTEETKNLIITSGSQNTLQIEPIPSSIQSMVSSDSSNKDAQYYCNFEEPECVNFGECFCDVEEGELLEFYMTWGWNPPNPALPICTWSNNLPPGATYPTVSAPGEVQGTFTWTPNNCQSEYYIFTSEAGQECYVPLGSSDVSINVLNINRLPELDPISTITINEGDFAFTSANAVDLDMQICGDDLVTYSLTQAECGVLDCPVIDPITGDFFWQTGIGDAGDYFIEVLVDDNFGGFDNIFFDIRVNAVTPLILNEISVTVANNDKRYEATTYRRGEDVYIYIVKRNNLSAKNITVVDSLGNKLNATEVLSKKKLIAPEGFHYEVFKISTSAAGPIGKYTATISITNGIDTIDITRDFTVIFSMTKPASWSNAEWLQWKHGTNESLYDTRWSPAREIGRVVQLDIYNALYTREINEIENGTTDEDDAAKKKREWVTEHTTYGNGCYANIKTYLNALLAHSNGSTGPSGWADGECSDNCMVLVGKLRAENIPARAVTGQWVRKTATSLWNYHCWAEYWNGTQWLILDATGGYEDTGVTQEDYWRDHSCEGGPRTGRPTAAPVTQDPNTGNKTSLIKEYNTSKPTPPMPPKSFSSLNSCDLTITTSTDKSDYIFGEDVNLTIEFQNNGAITQNVNSEINVRTPLIEETVQFAPQHTIPSEILILNDFDSLTIPPSSSVSKSFIITSTDYVDNGDFEVTTTTEDCFDLSFFTVDPGLDVTLTIPLVVDVNQTFTATVSVENLLGSQINDIEVRLITPFYATSDVTYAISSLSAGQTDVANIPMKIIHSGEHNFVLAADSSDTGFKTIVEGIDVLSPPVIQVSGMMHFPESPEVSETTTISAEITNLGDYTLINTVASLNISDDFFVIDPISQPLGSINPGTSVIVSWNVEGTIGDEYLYAISATDQNGNYDINFRELEISTLDICGDLDKDGFLTALDLAIMIDILFAGHPLPDPPWIADLDGDGFPTALDLAIMIDHLFAGAPEPTC